MDELTLSDYLTILKRRKNIFFGSFLILFTFSIIVMLSWSNYRSTATVEVEQPQVAGMNASDMPESLADLRINKIAQKVTSPASLVDIITKLNLYPQAHRSESMERLAKNMAKKIKLDLISSTVANPAATAKVSVEQLSAIAFTLSFDYSDPQIARQVTSELVTRFLNEDLKTRRQDAEATSEFLDNQIKTLETSLADQEQKIAKFKNKHGISGPESVIFNQQAAATTSMTLQNVDAQIASNEGTQGTLRAQLASVDPYSRVIADGQILTTPSVQLKALEAQYASLTAQYGPEHPDVVKVGHQIDSLRVEVGGHEDENTAALKVQIKDIDVNLAAAKKTYGADNPDVISLKNQRASLVAQVAAAQKNPTRHNSIKQDADNPAYLALVSQINSLEEQHKSLIDQHRALSAQQAKYEEALANDPVLEQEMSILTRDHDNAELRDRELRERKMAADMDVKMIKDHKGQRLAVISPPDLPLHTHPRGLMIFMGGLFLSLIGGFASVILAQTINQNIIGAHHLTSLVGVAPLVIIPHITTQDEKSRSAHHLSFEILRKLRTHCLAVLQPRGES